MEASSVGSAVTRDRWDGGGEGCSRKSTTAWCHSDAHGGLGGCGESELMRIPRSFCLEHLSGHCCPRRLLSAGGSTGHLAV